MEEAIEAIIRQMRDRRPDGVATTGQAIVYLADVVAAAIELVATGALD